MYDRAMPDIAVTCDSSKYFRTDTEAFDAVRSMPSVASFTESVEETVFLTYDREEGTALLKGVEQSYTENPEIQSRATPRIPRYSPASSTESSP